MNIKELLVPEADSVKSISENGPESPELDSKSLTSTIRNFEYSNGRRYHGYRAGEYLLPNDEKEQERMLLLDHIWKMLLGGRIMRTNLKDPEHILDIGTGSGEWAIDAADLWPKARVIGTDLSPIQPDYVPENCHFLIEDAESDWDWDEPFDLIHGRTLSGAFRDWPRFYKQCFTNLKPGGHIEMQDHNTWNYAAPTGRVPPWIDNWNKEENDAFKAFGKELNVADRHGQWMTDAGFVDVEDQVHKVPVGTWAKDPVLKELGRYMLAQMLEVVEPYSLEVFTRVLGKTLEETQIAIEMIKQELKQKRNHLYVRFHFVTGRKPIQ